MTSNLLPLIATFAVSWFLTRLAIMFAHRHSLFALPEARSSHVVPTPTSGGIAILSAFLCFFAWHEIILGGVDFQILMVVSLAVVIGLLGYVDDRMQVPVRWRLPLQFVATVILVLSLERLPGVNILDWEFHAQSLSVVIYTLILVWLINLYNFMDGIDGIAAVEAITVIIGVAVILWLNGDYRYLIWLIALALSVLGFGLLNWAPAKIFMGDVGSGFLGFMLGGLALVTASGGVISLWSWVILLAVFVADASITLVTRALRREVVYQAHRSHAYQILSRRWRSHSRVSILCGAINLFWLLPLALMATIWPYFGIIFAVLAYVPLLWLVVKVGAGTTND